ncbi:MAG: patatin-like phospholipase family protein [Patescibacteria group bacterium]|jgi:NTE family protein
MKIGLALSSGGVLGAAHAGVIESLEKNHIKINSVCGTSVGAIAGVLYAAKGSDGIDEFFVQLDKLGIFTFKNVIRLRRPERIFKQLEEIIRKIVKVDRFDQLPIHFSCVATDIISGEVKLFTTGDPVKCVIASAAYPGLFPIQKVGEHHYIDGGISLNLPVSPLKDQGVGFVIVSSVYKLADFNKQLRRPSRVQIASRAFDIMESRINAYELDKADFVFTPMVQEFSWYDFSQMPRIRETGRLYAHERVKDLVKQLEKKS